MADTMDFQQIGDVPVVLVRPRVFFEDVLTLDVACDVFTNDQAAVEAGFTQSDCDRARSNPMLATIHGSAGLLQAVPLTTPNSR